MDFSELNMIYCNVFVATVDGWCSEMSYAEKSEIYTLHDSLQSVVQFCRADDYLVFCAVSVYYESFEENFITHIQQSQYLEFE
jgi:hypothetical protein